jgi:hypothetical protein
MGLFSVNCLGCGHSLRSSGTHGHGHWTNYAVVLTQEGSRIVGEYDGYGNVGSYEDAVGHKDVSAYHRACWMLLGQPDHFTVASEHAVDQGYFAASEPCRPLTLGDLAALRAVAEQERKEAQRAWNDAYASLSEDVIL